jgi:hypothetical protein
LTQLLPTGYGTLLLHARLLHFVIILCHSIKVNLETLQIIVSFPSELIELGIFLL